PFGDALAAATALAQGRPEVAAPLAKLKDAAAKGVPSLAVLRERFDSAAGAIADAAGAEGGAGWLDRIRRGLGIRVRAVGPDAAAGQGPGAAVARAENALAAGDLAAAVAALDTLRGA